MKKIELRDINRIAVSVALLVICAWISVPAPVPFTLQTFGVFLVSGALGKKRGTVAVLIYILLGAVGIPVFSGGRGGLGILFGDTGGYIFGFLAAAFVCGSFCERKEKSIGPLVLAMLFGLFVCYLIGSAWVYFVYLNADGFAAIAVVLVKYVLSFVVWDVLKIVLAAICVRGLKKRGFC